MAFVSGIGLLFRFVPVLLDWRALGEPLADGARSLEDKKNVHGWMFLIDDLVTATEG